MMKDKDLSFKNIFVRFLKEHDIYACFKENLTHSLHQCYDIDSYIKLIMRNHSFSCAISYAFTWNDCIEGYDFWSDIDDGWRMYFEKKLYINT